MMHFSIPPSEVKLPHFREDPREYATLQRHWEELFKSVSTKRPDLIWEVWLNDQFREGHPIFSRVSKQVGKGIAINQVLPDDDSLAFRSWMSRFGFPEYHDEIVCLNISCMFVAKIDQLVAELLMAFVIKDRSYLSMEKLCARFTNASAEVAW